MELFFDHINGNLLLRGVINELYDAVAFPRSKKLQSGGQVLLGFGDAVHAGEQHHRPIPFHRPNVANPISIELQLISVDLWPVGKSTRSSSAGRSNARCLHRRAPDRCSRRHGAVPAPSADLLSKPAVNYIHAT